MVSTKTKIKSKKTKKRTIYFRLIDAEKIEIKGKGINLLVQLKNSQGERRQWRMWFPEQRISEKSDGFYCPQWLLDLKNRELKEQKGLDEEIDAVRVKQESE